MGSPRMFVVLTGSALLAGWAGATHGTQSPGDAAPGQAQAPAERQASSKDAQSGVPALPRGKKLVLKDGTFQLVRDYRRNGERVRYLSAERGDWEEIPAAVVDWDATAKLFAEIGADGINGDTLRGVPRVYRTASDRVGHPLAPLDPPPRGQHLPERERSLVHRRRPRGLRPEVHRPERCAGLARGPSKGSTKTSGSADDRRSA